MILVILNKSSVPDIFRSPGDRSNTGSYQIILDRNILILLHRLYKTAEFVGIILRGICVRPTTVPRHKLR